jgi:hypothetical protein
MQRGLSPLLTPKIPIWGGGIPPREGVWGVCRGEMGGCLDEKPPIYLQGGEGVYLIYPNKWGRSYQHDMVSVVNKFIHYIQ